MCHFRTAYFPKGPRAQNGGPVQRFGAIRLAALGIGVHPQRWRKPCCDDPLGRRSVDIGEDDGAPFQSTDRGPSQRGDLQDLAGMQRNNKFYGLLNRATIYNGFQRLLPRGDIIALLVEQYAALKPGERVLDIGCGTGTLAPYVKENDYFGFDPNADYIATARKANPAATFAIGTVNDIANKLTRRFDVAFAIGVLHHLGDADAGRLIDMAKAILRPGGRLLTFDGVFRNGQNLLAHVLLKLDRGQAVRTIEGYRTLAAAHFDRVDVHVRDDLLRVPYEHAILVCYA